MDIESIKLKFYDCLARIEEKANSFRIPLNKYNDLINEVKEAKNRGYKESRDYWLLKHYDVMTINEKDKLIFPFVGDVIIYYAFVEEVFDILFETHISIGHGGRDKMRAELQQKYKNITFKEIQLFLNICECCQQKRNGRNKEPFGKPITSMNDNAVHYNASYDVDIESEPDSHSLSKKISRDDWKSWCRLCASDGNHAIDIFLNQIDDNSSIAEDLNKFCNLKLENKEELPTKICEVCQINIKKLKEFLMNSFKTQQLLTDLVFNQEDDSLTILKTEVDLNQNFFSENKFNEERKIKQEISGKKVLSNIFENKSFDKSNDENCMVDSEEDVLDNLFLSEIKNKINKKRCKNNLKQQELHFQCKICAKSFLSQGGLTKHLRKRHSINKDPHSCKFCDKIFENRRALENHENTHLPSQERKHFLCPHCDKKLTSEKGIWIHIHFVHNKKKSVICEECGKGFFTKQCLARHKISHTEEKKFQCPHCPSKLKTKGGLTTHLHSHGESHPCVECGAVLKTKQLLKNHMIVHSDVKNFKCNFCNKDFKRMDELNRHLIIHTGIKPFECFICNQKFVHKVSYHRHLKAAHPKELAEKVAKGERLPGTNYPPMKQLKAINEAAKESLVHD